MALIRKMEAGSMESGDSSEKIKSQMILFLDLLRFRVGKPGVRLALFAVQFPVNWSSVHNQCTGTLAC